jgi:hypothetical protein
MSGYSVTERKLGKDRRPRTSTCGDCGEPVVNGKLLCDDCIAEIAACGPVLSEVRRER